MRFLNKVLLTLSLSIHVLGWGDLGHRTVALIAQKYLTREASQVLKKILVNSRGFTFDDAAKWADTIKHSRPETAEWHYVDARDAPPTKCGLNYPSDCKAQKDGCIISAISDQTAAFLDPNSSDIVRKEALMFIMHLIGDLHQPLHVEDAYRGGNEIHPVAFGTVHTANLHSVWDKYIPHKICGLRNAASDEEEKTAAAEWAERLFNLNEKNGVSAQSECTDLSNPNTCSLSWAGESNRWICKHVLKESKEWLESNDLSEGYYTKAIPIVEDLIGKGGARLGAWLNALVASISELHTEGHQQFLGDDHPGL